MTEFAPVSAVVDRVVDGREAVLLIGEAEVECIVPVDDLPPAAEEGVWLQIVFVEGALVAAVVDEKKTAEMRRRVASKRDLLRKRGRRPPGNG